MTPGRFETRILAVVEVSNGDVTLQTYPGNCLESLKYTVTSLSTDGLQDWTETWHIVNKRQEGFPQDYGILSNIFTSRRILTHQ